MTRPGDRLRAAASRVCSARTMERVIDPVIADLQCEHAASPRTWRRYWIRLSGYVAFWKTVCLHTGVASSNAAHEWLAVENWAVGRTLVASGLAMTGFTVVLLPLTSGRILGAKLIYLVPSTLVVGLPFGFMAGVLFALRGRVVTRHALRGVAAIAVVLTGVQFGTLNWIMPSANQTFRVKAQAAIHGPAPARGYSEMSLAELTREANAQLTRGMPGASFAMMKYGMLWELCAAPLILGSFALTLATGWRGIVSPIAIVIATQLSYLAYFDWATRLARATDSFSMAGGPLVLAIAWIPNFAVALVAAILFRRGRSRLEPSTG